jgi:excisionase family DNA binding protein
MVDNACVLVRVSEVARRLGICRSSVYKLLEEGEMAYVQIGGIKRIPEEALEAFLQENTVTDK